MWGNALPWEKTDLTPNLGRIDSTADMRPGLGLDGVEHLKDFVEKGGLLITSEDTAQFAIDEGMAPGVFVNHGGNVRVVGSVLAAQFVDRKNPVAWGYGENLAVYSAEGMAFTVGNMTVPRHIETEKDYHRATGRGGPEEEDIPQGRAAVEPEPLPSPKPWEATPLNEEEARNNPYVIPEQDRPDVILRFRGDEGLVAVGAAGEWRSDRGEADRGGCALRPGECAAVREQPDLSGGDDWELWAGDECDSELRDWPSRRKRCAPGRRAMRRAVHWSWSCFE